MTLAKRVRPADPAKTRRVTLHATTILKEDGTMGPLSATVEFDFADAQNRAIPDSTASADLIPHASANYKTQLENAIAAARTKIEAEVLAP